MKKIDEYKIIYKFLAIKFDLYRRNKYHGVEYFEEARIFIVDLNKDDFNISTEVAINLLYPINTTLLHVRNFFSSLPAVIKSVREINDFVLNYFNISLDDFVNSIEWENNCIPYYWVELCKISGYNINSWNLFKISFPLSTSDPFYFSMFDPFYFTHFW